MGHLFSFPADLSSAINAAWHGTRRNLKQADRNASALNKTFEVFYKDCGVVLGDLWGVSVILVFCWLCQQRFPEKEVLDQWFSTCGS